MESTEREPTIDDVLRELHALRADHDQQLHALRADHDQQWRTLRADMEIHGRAPRRTLDGLPGAVAEAVVAAVDRTFGAELRALREDID